MNAETFTVKCEAAGPHLTFCAARLTPSLCRHVVMAPNLLDCRVSADIDRSEGSTSARMPSSPKMGLNCPVVATIQCEITLPVGFDQVSALLSCPIAAG